MYVIYISSTLNKFTNKQTNKQTKELLSSTLEFLVADQHEIENICAPKTTTNMAPFSRRKL